MELKELCNKCLEIFEIKDISELSDRLETICFENEQDYMARFVDIVQNLSVDWLQKIFQYYEADRKEKKQDYTPKSLARFISLLTEHEGEKTIYDLCAGSGSLTIQKWNTNKDLTFYCYELDQNVIPLLIFNLAVRNMNAYVYHMDVLEDELFCSYRIMPGKRFSHVSKVDKNMTGPFEKEPIVYDSCISNPPYNLKWKLPLFAQVQQRFAECALPPEGNANYAFILTALDKCRGKTAMILPTGVLSSNNTSEYLIRKHLIEKNYIEAVLLNPDRMFESTSIGTCILLFNKKKKTRYISFIDMRETYEIEQREQNGQFGGASHENRTYKKNLKYYSDE